MQLPKKVNKVPDVKTIPKELLSTLKEHLTLIGIVIPGLIYSIGYIKASFFLSAFDVMVTPIDVYSYTSLLAAGWNTAVQGLFYPLVNILVGISSCYCLSHKRIGKFSVLLGVVIGLVYLFLIFKLYTYLPRNLYFIPLFDFLPDTEKGTAWTLYFLAMTIVQVLVAFMVKYKENKKWRIILTVVLSIWLVIFLVSQLAAFKHLDVPAGAVGQSGVGGTITTELPISVQSKKIDKENKTYFETPGILINKTDGTYYFIPIGKNNEGYCDYKTSIAVLPSTKVLGFYGDFK